MQHTAQELRHIINEIAPLLVAIPKAEVFAKPEPEKWSKAEILGHLLDSAANNHHKFIRMMAQPHLNFVGYDQNFWVSAQHYNETSWELLIALWQRYNDHLAHIIEYTPNDSWGNTISINNSEPFTLKFIIQDYVEHLKHHLKQILPEANFTNTFVNVYSA